MVLRSRAGNGNIHLLTTVARQKLRVDLGDFEGNKTYAEYDDFSVGSEEEQYKLLTIGTYNGTAGQCGVNSVVFKVELAFFKIIVQEAQLVLGIANRPLVHE